MTFCVQIIPKNFLCLYTKKSVAKKKRNFKMVLYTPLLRIYPCYRDILWILYIMGGKKKLCLFWMAEANATLVYLTLLFSSSSSITWFTFNKGIQYALLASNFVCASVQDSPRFWGRGAELHVACVFTRVAWRCSAWRFCSIADRQLNPHSMQTAGGDGSILLLTPISYEKI